MSTQKIDSAIENLLDAAVRHVWSAWAALGFMGEGAARSTCIIDPEALVLGSGVLSACERRIEDAVAWWAAKGSHLMSTQRLKNLTARAPSIYDTITNRFATRAMTAGELRWRKLAAGVSGEPGPTRRRIKGPNEPDFSQPAALMLKLRAGFGVGPKPDFYSFLLGRGERGATIREAVEDLAYSSRTLQVIATDMRVAGFIRSDQRNPPRFFAALSPVMNSSEISWPGSFVLLSFTAEVMRWNERFMGGRELAFAASSKARDIVEGRASLAGFVPHGPLPGADYLPDFIRAIEHVTSRLTPGEPHFGSSMTGLSGFGW